MAGADVGGARVRIESGGLAREVDIVDRSLADLVSRVESVTSITGLGSGVAALEAHHEVAVVARHALTGARAPARLAVRGTADDCGARQGRRCHQKQGHHAQKSGCPQALYWRPWSLASSRSVS